MEPILNDLQIQLRDSAKRLCKDFGGAVVYRQRHQHQGVTNAWQQIMKAGWTGLLVSDEHNGLGLGLYELALILDEAGQHLWHEPVAASCAGAYVLSKTNLSNHLKHVLEDGVMVLPVCVDVEDTYNNRQSAPVLQNSGDHWVLNGLVRFVSFVNLESLLLISVIDEQGRHALVSLSAKAMGVLLTRHARLDDSLVSDIEFKDVEIQSQDILAWDDTAIQLIEEMKTILRVGISAQLLGLSHAALEMTLEHLRIRKQFGKPLARFQALQHQCVNGYLDIELNRSLLYRTSMAWDKHQSHPAMISALKARTSRSALAITRSAVQLHGAMGYTHEHNIGLYYKQAVVWASEQGNDVYHAHRFSALTLNVEPFAWTTQS